MHRSSERNSAERSTNLTTEEESIIAGETIAAISTPAGEGAIALVRVAGPDAIAVADKVFRGKEEPSRFASIDAKSDASEPFFSAASLASWREIFPLRLRSRI